MNANKIKELLLKSTFTDLSPQLESYAAVAVILWPNTSSFKIGFIQRAHHPSDKWSGQVAFPGGKKDAGDVDHIQTAIRETYEEVGIQLSTVDCLGRLSDIQGRNRLGLQPFFIRPFVFWLENESQPSLDNTEVADFFTVELEWLVDSRNREEYPLQIENSLHKMPSIVMPNKLSLWGLTYLITSEFLEKIKKG